MTPFEQVIKRLKGLEFTVQGDRNGLFGQPLPYLRAIATDAWAHQLVLVAEDEAVPEDVESQERREQAWRELIFAVAGLRHHLRGSGLPALSAPVLLALVDEQGRADLCRWVEEIAEDYALFSRVDINLVDIACTSDPERLDEAMTSLLPRVRDSIRNKSTATSRDVKQFWEELTLEVERASERMAKKFGEQRANKATHGIQEALQAWWDEFSEQGAGGKKVAPISRLMIESFRSFEEVEVKVPAAGIVHGANGSGKTSVCEAMEILWSGRTHRIPEGIKKSVYEEHVRREREPFHLSCEFFDESPSTEATRIEDLPTASLGRAVLPQHVIREMAESEPRERFRSFLVTSGLDLPEFEEVVERLKRTTFEEANTSLTQAELDPMPAVNVSGVGHLEKLMADAGFTADLPSRATLEGGVDALARATSGAYAPERSLFEYRKGELQGFLGSADAMLARVRSELDRAPDPTQTVELACEALMRESRRLTEIAGPLRRLADHFKQIRSGLEKQDAPPRFPSAPVPPHVAARWLSNVRGVRGGIPELERMRKEISHPKWNERLKHYVTALEEAVHASSAEDLEAMAHAEEPTTPTPASDEPPPKLLESAGFTRPFEPTPRTIAAIEDLNSLLTAHAAELDRLGARLYRHPARVFIANAGRIMPAICEFELGRELTKPTGGALARARQSLVTEMLDDKLTPVVQELAAALVRFEWYFPAPLEVKVEGRQMRLSGLATRNPKLDVRMMLNEAERTTVGIAWFLALHILQPEEDRAVLVLDDPVSGFDDTNKAAFAATLRTVLHMLKPQQFLITTHDEAAAALFEQELATVGGWPEDFAVLRCKRTEKGTSIVTREEDNRLGPANLERELAMLSVDGSSVSEQEGFSRS